MREPVAIDNRASRVIPAGKSCADTGKESRMMADQAKSRHFLRDCRTGRSGTITTKLLQSRSELARLPAILGSLASEHLASSGFVSANVPDDIIVIRLSRKIPLPRHRLRYLHTTPISICIRCRQLA